MAFVFRLRSKIKVAHCKFSDLESILYFWPRGSLDAIYLREGSIHKLERNWETKPKGRIIS